MLGVIFVSFTDFVEAQYGLDAVDHVLDTELPSGGAYTAVGTYDFKEMVVLVQRLSQRIQQPVPQLLIRFGQNLFHRLADAYPHFVTQHDGPLALLAELENHIHVEVQKLYPDAELPSLSHESNADGEMLLLYRSPRNLPDFCEGLIRGCFEYFGAGVKIERSPLPSADQGVRFHIVQQAIND